MMLLRYLTSFVFSTAVMHIYVVMHIYASTIESSLVPEKLQDLNARNENYAEILYNYQNRERHVMMADHNNEILKANPNWPCFDGMTILGNSDHPDVKSALHEPLKGIHPDGHKHVCALHTIKDNPIVYSFGSRRDDQFEVALLEYRPDSTILIFEIDADGLPPIERRNKALAYFHLGLGYKVGSNMKSLAGIMAANNHSYIDILKMDIEGFEFEFLEQEGHLLKNIGQFLVEVHDLRHPLKTTAFLEAVEMSGLRLFHKEINLHYTRGCAEFSFIQKNWRSWQTHKHSFNYTFANINSVISK